MWDFFANVLTKTLSYGYDADGNRNAITYPDGKTQTYTYEHEQLKTVQLPNGQSMTWDGYQWQRPGQIAMPGSVQTLSYDALQRTKGIDVKTNTATVLNRAYTYDKAGNIIERQTEEGAYSYGYDLLDRVTQVNPPQNLQSTSPPTLPVEAFAYDAVHNRIGSAQQPGDWQYNANNQLLQFGEGTEQTVYTYTANGHVATEATPAAQGGETKTYTYDATDRLVRVHSGNNEVARYAYDPFGRRISKTVSGVTTHYLYTDEGLIAELDSAGNIQVAYGWQADTMFGTAPLWQAQVGNSNLQTADYHFIITDHLGTPQMAVNQNGQTTWKATSEVFGKTTPNAENQITMNLRFPGQYYDAETNMHYNYFRDYNPAVGRYVQRDPIGLEGGMNIFTYAMNRPIDMMDPLGLKICTEWRDSDWRGPLVSWPAQLDPNDYPKCSEIEFKACTDEYADAVIGKKLARGPATPNSWEILNAQDKLFNECLFACKEGGNECNDEVPKNDTAKKIEQCMPVYDKFGCWSTPWQTNCKDKREEAFSACLRNLP